MIYWLKMNVWTIRCYIHLKELLLLLWFLGLHTGSTLFCKAVDQESPSESDKVGRCNILSRRDKCCWQCSFPSLRPCAIFLFFCLFQVLWQPSSNLGGILRWVEAVKIWRGAPSLCLYLALAKTGVRILSQIRIMCGLPIWDGLTSIDKDIRIEYLLPRFPFLVLQLDEDYVIAVG